MYYKKFILLVVLIEKYLSPNITGFEIYKLFKKRCKLLNIS